MTDTPSAGEPTDPVTGDAVPATAAPAHARYTFGRPLGEGGMGSVFAARDAALNREVAVKVLADRYPADSPTARRFLDEARITGQLQHPGIPPVHDLGTLPDGRPFLAMKLIKGQTLDDLLKDRADPTADRGRLMAVFEATCQAVGYAHAHRVIHRDLKPANVMVGAFGEVQVMDWGLAKVLTSGGACPRRTDDPDATAAGTHIDSDRDSDFHTRAGSVLGTPAYMPPEQAAGAVGEVDARSDVFGLGAILCVILTGQPPYLGSSAESVRVLAARAAVADAFARLDASGAEPDLIELCKRCLSPDMAARPADAGEVATAVGRFREDAENRARRAELDRARAEVQAAEQRKRRRVQAALGLAVSVLVGLIGFGAWWRDKAVSEKAAADERVAFDRERELTRERDQSRRAVAEKTAEAAVRLSYQLLDKLWIDEADDALVAAEAAVGEDGPADARNRIRAVRRDVQFVAQLDAIRTTFVLTEQADRVSTVRAAAGKEYSAVFREFGFELRSETRDETVARMKASPVRKHILTALDTWMVNEPGDITRAIVWTYATAVGPESWRPKLMVEWRTTKAVQRLFDEAKPEDRTAALYDYVGSRLLSLTGDGSKVFEEGVVRYPADPLLRYKAGMNYYYRGQYARAAAEFLTATVLRPSFARGWRMLALSRYWENDATGARAAAVKAVGLDDRAWDAHLTLAWACAAMKDWEPAKAAARKAAERTPTGPLPYTSLGRYEYFTGNDSAAVAAFEIAAERHRRLNLPGIYPGSVDWGLALFALGRWEEAEKIHRAVLAANPTSDLLNYHAAMLCRRRGNVAAAATHFQKGSGGKPQSPANWDYLYAVSVRKYWDISLLIRVWESACARAPDDPNLLSTLGVFYYLHSRHADAVRVLKRADDLGRQRAEWPNDTAFWASECAIIAAYHFRATADAPGYYATGYEVARRGVADIDRFPLNNQIYANLGWLALATGHLDDAEQAFRRGAELLKYSPHNQLMNFEHALMLRRRGRVAEANQAFVRAAGQVDLSPDHQDDLYTEYLAKYGIEIRADMFESAVRAVPGDPYLRLTLGALYRRMSRHTEAAAAFAKADELGRTPGREWPYPTTVWAYEEGKKAAPFTFPKDRRRALDWLIADLGKCPPPALLARWQTDPDLAAVRHPIAVAFLPADERDQWRKLWADVRKLHADTAPKPAIRPR